MNKYKFPLNIQLFGEGEDGTGSNGEVLTFDEILEDKFYQSEFDKRVTKALNTQSEKLQEQHKAEISELEKKLNLNEEQSKELQNLKASLEGERVNRIYEVALAKTGVKDLVSLKAHTQHFLEKPEITDDGNIKGLNEFLDEKLKGDLAHLKPLEENNKATGGRFGNPPPKEDTKEDQMKANMGL